MIAYWAKRTPGEDFERLQTPLENVGVWLNGTELTDSELQSIVDTHQLDTNIVSDVRDHAELPRVEFSNGAIYVFMRLPHVSKTGRVITRPLLGIIKDTQFFTLTTDQGVEPEKLALSTLPITSEHTQTLLLGVMAATVALFEDVVLHTSRSITDTSNRLRTHEITNRDFIHFVTVEGNLNHVRMNLDSTLTMVRRLHENKHETFDEASLEALDDIALHIQQLLVSIQSHLETVSSIRNAYSTVANNALNQRMKTLTVFTVLIALPNVFYGMFGMNVLLPFADEPWAYAGIVGFTFVLLIVVYLVAKSRRIF